MNKDVERAVRSIYDNFFTFAVPATSTAITRESRIIIEITR